MLIWIKALGVGLSAGPRGGERMRAINNERRALGVAASLAERREAAAVFCSARYE